MNGKWKHRSQKIVIMPEKKQKKRFRYPHVYSIWTGKVSVAYTQKRLLEFQVSIYY